MVTIQLFGMTKMLAGNQGTLSLSLHDGKRVKDLVSVIDAAYPKIGELLQKKKIRYSTNFTGWAIRQQNQQKEPGSAFIM